MNKNMVHPSWFQVQEGQTSYLPCNTMQISGDVQICGAITLDAFSLLEST